VINFFMSTGYVLWATVNVFMCTGCQINSASVCLDSSWNCIVYFPASYTVGNGSFPAGTKRPGLEANQSPSCLVVVINEES
jgi:hypothetical protein